MRSWFRRQPKSELAEHAQRFWRSTSIPPLGGALEATRWVCMDTETSGLDPYKDNLISVGACVVTGGALDLRTAFEVVLRQASPSAVDNVLVHGIGHASQSGGMPADRAMDAYLRFSGQSVVVGFHTLFDVVMLRRIARTALGVAYEPLYLDLAFLLPALLPQEAPAPRDLDGWLTRLRLAAYARHQALADAVATAQLLLICLDRARRRGLGSLRDMLSLQKSRMETQVSPTL